MRADSTPAALLALLVVPFLAHPRAAQLRGRDCRLARQSLDTAAVLATEREWVRASAARDSAALACVLTPEFLDTDWRGVLRTRGDLVRALAHRGSYIQDIGEMRIVVFGRAAVARGVNVVRDASGHEVARLRFTDVLRYDDGAWRAVAAQETPVAPETRPG